MTVVICPFDNLYIHVLLEIFILILFALQVVVVEVVVDIVVVLAVVVNTVVVVAEKFSNSVHTLLYGNCLP